MTLPIGYNSVMDTGENGNPKRAEEVRITFRMPADVAEGIRASAKANDRSLNGEIVRALREYLTRQQHQKGNR
ncbi:MAG TPA: Arc family DNA-binding protein [Ktedonobacterales bacterium]|nr:Arc family DNA-binding protein [Ktedonobacterales bacterium]